MYSNGHCYTFYQKATQKLGKMQFKQNNPSQTLKQLKVNIIMGRISGFFLNLIGTCFLLYEIQSSDIWENE